MLVIILEDAGVAADVVIVRHDKFINSLIQIRTNVLVVFHLFEIQEDLFN